MKEVAAHPFCNLGPPCAGTERTADLVHAVAVAGGDPSLALETVVQPAQAPEQQAVPHAARFEPDVASRCSRCSARFLADIGFVEADGFLALARLNEAHACEALTALHAARTRCRRWSPQQQRAPTSSRRAADADYAERASSHAADGESDASEASGKELAEESVGTEESAEGLLVDPTATEGLLSRPGTAMARGGLRDEVDSAAALIRPSTAMMLWEVHDAAPAGHVSGGAPDVLVIDHDAPSDDSDDDDAGRRRTPRRQRRALAGGAGAAVFDSPGARGAVVAPAARARRAW